jgi:hypothetical protein
MVRPLLRAQVISLACALALPLTHPPFSVAVTDLGTFLSWGSITGLAVLVVWNLVRPDREGREERLEAAREQRRLIMEHASPRAGREQWEAAALEARRAGTFSLGGVRQPGATLRYAGPPPVYTPPGGIEMVITVELRAVPQAGRLSPDYGWSCEECGEPVTEGRRFCRPCLTHGMPGYNAEIRTWL